MKFSELKNEIDTLTHYFMRNVKDCAYSKEISGLKGSVLSNGDYYVCRACDAELVIAHIAENKHWGIERINMGDYVFLNVYLTLDEDAPLLIGRPRER